MYVGEMKIFIQNFVDPIRDKMFIDIIQNGMYQSSKDDFETYANDLCQYSFPFHLVEKVNQHLVIKNLQDTDTIIASICALDSPPMPPSGKRWTHSEIRLVRRCFPYIQKWPHLLRVLKRRTWEEIEQKAKDINKNRRDGL